MSATTSEFEEKTYYCRKADKEVSLYLRHMFIQAPGTPVKKFVKTAPQRCTNILSCDVTVSKHPNYPHEGGAMYDWKHCEYQKEYLDQKS